MNYLDTQLLINNQWRDGVGNAAIDVLNPATGEQIGKVAHASIVDLDSALLAAQQGFEKWRGVPAIERQRVMRNAAALLRERLDEISILMTWEQGKPVAEAKTEILAAADIVEWFADEGMRAYGRMVPPRRLGVQQLVFKEPVGPVAAFTPWNFPITQIARKLGAALASGCSILVKAPEETPASPAAFIRCFVDAGAPAGVVGLVFGDPAQISAHLIAHPVIRKVTFTGSTQVGKQLAALAGLHMKRVTMELGGHAPVIVAEDADVDLAVRSAGAAKFRNAGQVCIAPTRFLVHSSLQHEFAEKLAVLARSLKIGSGMVEGTTMGPLANPRRVVAMERLVADAERQGAHLVAGGRSFGSGGNFFEATVLSNVSVEASIFNEEPFGPVAAIRSFDHLGEAIDEANRLSYGLAGYAFTRSLKNAHLLSQQVQVGMLWINQPALAVPEMPFGGMKDSGYGSEGGPEAIEAFIHTKAVSVAMG